MTGAFNNMNKGNVLIYFLYIHLMFYKKKKIHDRKPWIKAIILCSPVVLPVLPVGPYKFTIA